MSTAVATRVNVDRETTNPIENLAEFLGRLPGRFTDPLGIRVEQAGAERTVLTMACRPELTTPHGVIHGGAVAALADSAAGFATMAGLRPGEAFATAEMKLNLLGPAREGTLTAEASPVRRGRRAAVYEVKVTDGRARPIALFLCTQMILEQQKSPPSPPRHAVPDVRGWIPPTEAARTPRPHRSLGPDRAAVVDEPLALIEFSETSDVDELPYAAVPPAPAPGPGPGPIHLAACSQAPRAVAHGG